MLESILACLKQENEPLVLHFKNESRNKCTNLAQSLIIPTQMRPSSVIDSTSLQASKLACPFEGWSYSHLECQTCANSTGTASSRWLPTRHQVFTTLPLPIPSVSVSSSSSVLRRGDSVNCATTAGCLPAGHEETARDTLHHSSSGGVNSVRNDKSLLWGGGPIAVARSSSAEKESQTQSQHSGIDTGNVHVPRKLVGASPSLYNCLQEFFQEEELSGISCSACSSAATLQKVEHKLALITSSARRNRKTDSNENEDVELRILSHFQQDLKNMRVVGAKDAFIGDFEKGFIVNPLLGGKGKRTKEAIVHRPKSSTSKKVAPAVMDPAESLENDREMLLLSLKQPRFSAANKRTGLSRLPPLLCLYLCRRTYDEVKGRMKKLVAHVTFPVRLNVDQFQSADGAHRPTPAQAESAAGTGTGLSVASMLSAANMNGKGLHTGGRVGGGDYLLRAVVEHKGTAETGTHSFLFCNGCRSYANRYKVKYH